MLPPMKTAKRLLSLTVLAGTAISASVSYAQVRTPDSQVQTRTDESQERIQPSQEPIQVIEIKPPDNESVDAIPPTEWPLPGDLIMVCNDPDSEETCEVLDNDPEVDP